VTKFVAQPLEVEPLEEEEEAGLLRLEKVV
jgi:hypothetical protein